MTRRAAADVGWLLPRTTAVGYAAAVSMPTRWSAVFALVLAAAAPGCKRGPKSTRCAAAVANEQGVGRPCRTAADCVGSAATVCPVEKDPGDYDFCTHACTGANADECGADAECRFWAWGKGWCIPSSCAATLPNPEPQQVPLVVERCCVGQVNPLGVGRTCARQQDCAGLAASSCGLPRERPFGNWCTMKCAADKECGPGAFCLARRGPEGGAVSMCAPTECRVENNPAPCPVADGGAAR